MKKQLIAVLGAAVLLGGTASAQTMPQSMSSPMGMQPDAAMMMMPTSDAQFVSMISRTNEDDIDLARAVLARSKNDAVKTFAQRTIDDDSSSQVSLRSAARTGSYTVPTYGKRGDVRMGRALLAENEPKLDVDYMQMQLNRNRDTIAVLQWEIKNGTDAGLKAYASAQAPIAAVHAQMALAFGATEGKSTRVNVGGQILGGNGAPATAPNGTAGNNPASASGGSTTGTANGSGGVKNTPGSKGTSVPISPQTPAPNTAISPSPSPSPT
jgi:putative membrane protein